MKYSFPAYYPLIHPNFKKYFSKQYFDGKKHYPQTIADANKYILFDIYKVDQVKSFSVNVPVPPPAGADPQLDYVEKRQFKFPDSYKSCFLFENWSCLNTKQKIIALYWLCEEIKVMLDTPPTINFCFITLLNSDGTQGYYNHNFYANDFNINPDSLFNKSLSAFSIIETMAHELRHSQFGAIHQKKYMSERNNYYYYSYQPSEDLLEDMYNYLMYFFQPTELDAHKFGLSYAYNLYSQLTQDKEPNITDLYFFANEKSTYRYYSKIKKIMFNGKYNEHLDLYYLYDEFSYDLENQKLSAKKMDALTKDMDEIYRCIEEDKEDFKKNLMERYISQSKADIKHI